MPKANSEQGLDPRPFSNCRQADARLIGRAWTGRQDEPVIFADLNLLERFGIVSQDFALGTEFPEILYQIIGK